MLRRAGRFLQTLIINDNFDLYALALAAFVFTVLGATGLTSVTALLSMTLGVLALLAVSQIRSRRHVAEIAAAAGADPLGRLLTDFPEDVARRRATAAELVHIGVSMRRTAPTSLAALRQMLAAGGRIRVLLVDPTDDAVLTEALRRRGGWPDVDSLRATVLSSLGALTALAGAIEVRVSRSVPAAGISIVDASSRDGVLVVQHYEYRSAGEAAPILRLTPHDGIWYRHFLDEAERMWSDGVPWPLPPDVRTARQPRPAFLEDFGASLTEALDTAQDLLITGVARNTLLTTQYTRLEKKLAGGARLRFLLTEPDSGAVAVAADRYYAERSPDVLRARIDHSLRLLRELRRATGGDLQVRVTDYPFGAGMVAVGQGALFVEYLTYRARGEPKFVLTPADGWAYETLLGEAESLWNQASPIVDGLSAGGSAAGTGASASGS